MLCPSCTIPVTLGMGFSSRTTLLGEQRIRDEFNFLLLKLTSSDAARNVHNNKPGEWDAGVDSQASFPEQVLAQGQTLLRPGTGHSCPPQRSASASRGVY